MKLRAVFTLFSFSVSVSAFAKSNGGPTTCEDVGAITLMKQATLGLGVSVPIGEPQPFCDFVDEGKHSLVLASTLLSQNPSLAATAYRTGPKPVIVGGSERSDMAYCESLSGTVRFSKFIVNGGWTNPDGDGVSGICVFADGSMISTWTLFYKRIGAENRPNFEQFFQNSIIPARLW